MKYLRFIAVPALLLLPILACEFLTPSSSTESLNQFVTPTSPSPSLETASGEQLPEVVITLENQILSETTPTPPSLFPPALLVSYIKNGDIWLWRADGSKNQLTFSGMVRSLRVSPDGKIIAYLKQTDDFHAELWAVNTDGSHDRPLVSVFDLDEMAVEVRDPNAVAIIPYHFEWVPNSHTIAFNTQQVYQGPGLVLLDDLRLVNSDSIEIKTLLPPGMGGEFSYAPNGHQIAISTPTMISLIEANGENRLDILPYDQVITYSEYRYYANPIWSPDSTYLRVAIPPSDPLSDPRLPTSLWFIPTDGNLAYQTGNIYAEPFFSSEVTFSPDLSHIIFLRESGESSDNTSQLMIAKTDGSGEWVYQKARLLRFSGWGADSKHFVFMIGDRSEVQIGNIKETSRPINNNPFGILDVRWANTQLYLYLKENISTFDLVVESLEGDSITIDSIPAPPPVYDFF